MAATKQAHLTEDDVAQRLNELLAEGGEYVPLYVLNWLHTQFCRREAAAASREEERVYKNCIDGVDNAIAELCGWDLARAKGVAAMAKKRCPGSASEDYADASEPANLSPRSSASGMRGICEWCGRRVGLYPIYGVRGAAHETGWRLKWHTEPKRAR